MRKEASFFSTRLFPLLISVLLLSSIYVILKQQNGVRLRQDITALYNSGTQLAVQSVQSGHTIDTQKLQKAEQYLSGAADLGSPVHPELIHNLETVRRLLQQEQEKQNQESEQNGSGMQQQTGSGTTNQQNESGSGSAAQQQEKKTAEPTSTLSEATRQQLEQYQKQLASEQAQNQQFFNKQSNTPGEDPFALLEQFLGEQPTLNQRISGSDEKDW